MLGLGQAALKSLGTVKPLAARLGRPLPVVATRVTPLKISPYISIAASHSSMKA